MGEVVCAWCGKTIRYDPSISGVSHGMRDDCYRKSKASNHTKEPPRKKR
jgi:hypothetical protein